MYACMLTLYSVCICVSCVYLVIICRIYVYTGKALRGRSSIVKRKASRVIDIMCRLVQDPTHVTPFEPLLLPALDRVIDEVTDEEVC